MKKLGLIVNPIAGMGGRVGLKGTNGDEIFRKAIKLGAKPAAPARAIAMLKNLGSVRNSIQLITCSHEMGEQEARECGFEPVVISSIISGKTTAADTKEAANKMRKLEVDLILFVGGDGTAKDIYDVVRADVPILGAPAGVKVYSATFANTPESAGQVAARFLSEGLPVQEAEVMDIDEDAFRENRLVAELKGYARVPYEPVMMQATKEGSVGFELADQKAIARWTIELMERDRVYILGPGTTTRAVAEELGIYDSTLLGVNLVYDFKLIARDVSERQILEVIENRPATIIVSPIGKQGFIFGRGNQQISPRVVRRVGKKNILVLATPRKLSLTSTLKVDTGDAELDDELRGYIPVVVGYLQTHMVKVI
ncbi:MAG TPA: ATP-NAD kinase [Hadesarchaea archaeon]|nr:ATP-NAD kinase [Hadesarchaea archaeon]